MSQNILITGTNSGFGRLAAVSLAEKGHHVYATLRDINGRNAEAAKSLAAVSDKIHLVEMEVTSEASVEKAVASVLEKAGHLDVVVNNAGYAIIGLEETVTTDQLMAQLDVNVAGPHRVMRAALPSMKAAGKGLFIQISSGFGRFLFPFFGVYCASKVALEAISEAYRYELKPTGVEVTLIQPGAFPTDLSKKLNTGADTARAKGYGQFENAIEFMWKTLDTMFSGPDVANPQLVADAIVKLVETPNGTRPPRVVVDPAWHQMTETLNEAHAQIQRIALNGLGLSSVAD